ncbi:MAG: chemotaxis protein, partial [Gallionella sp.]
MFSGKLRQEHQALQTRLTQTDQEIAALRNSLSMLESERDAVRAELERVRAEHQTSARLYANMQGFGRSEEH